MTPKEARRKFCPMSMNVPDMRDIRYCNAYDCAVWEVDQTNETVYAIARPEGEGWENIAKFGHEWTRLIPIDEQPGQCGFITKWNE